MANNLNQIEPLIENSNQIYETDSGGLIFKCPLDTASSPNSCAKFIWIIPAVDERVTQRDTTSILRFSKGTERLEANVFLTFIRSTTNPRNTGSLATDPEDRRRPQILSTSDSEREEAQRFAIILENEREPEDPEVQYHRRRAARQDADAPQSRRPPFRSGLEFRGSMRGSSTTSPRIAKFDLELDQESYGILSKICVLANDVMKWESEWLYCKKEGSYVFDTNSAPVPLDFEQLRSSCIPSLNVGGILIRNCVVVAIEFTPLPNKTGRTLSTLGRMYDIMLFPDFQFIVSNGEASEIIKAHKAVLAASSKYFETMLTTPLGESQIAKVENFEPIIIKELLKYIYKGEADLEVHAPEMLKCADYYQIQELFQLCEVFIAERLTNYSWTQLFDLLHLYPDRLPSLTKEVIEYYRTNSEVLGQSQEFEAATARDHILPIFHQLFFSKLDKP